MKKVLVVSSSLRHGSNSDALAEEFAKGALEAGNEEEHITLKGMELQFCRGCLACQKTGTCIIKDGMADVLGKVCEADVLCFATPIYYYGLSGQLKVFLDRCNPLYIAEYKFRDIYLLTTAAEDEPTTSDKTKIGLMGWIECFPKTELKGSVFCGGVTDPNEIKENPALRQAFLMGKSIR